MYNEYSLNLVSVVTLQPNQFGYNIYFVNTDTCTTNGLSASNTTTTSSAVVVPQPEWEALYCRWAPVTQCHAFFGGANQNFVRAKHENNGVCWQLVSRQGTRSDTKRCPVCGVDLGTPSTRVEHCKQWHNGDQVQYC